MAWGYQKNTSQPVWPIGTPAPLTLGEWITQAGSVGLVIENRTSDPASPVVGQMWIRTDL